MKYHKNDWDKGYLWATQWTRYPIHCTTTRFRLGYQAGLRGLKRKRLETILLNEKPAKGSIYGDEPIEPWLSLPDDVIP